MIIALDAKIPLSSIHDKCLGSTSLQKIPLKVFQSKSSLSPRQTSIDLHQYSASLWKKNVASLTFHSLGYLITLKHFFTITNHDSTFVGIVKPSKILASKFFSHSIPYFHSGSPGVDPIIIINLWANL